MTIAKHIAEKGVNTVKTSINVGSIIPTDPNISAMPIKRIKV